MTKKRIQDDVDEIIDRVRKKYPDFNLSITLEPDRTSLSYILKAQCYKDRIHLYSAIEIEPGCRRVRCIAFKILKALVSKVEEELHNR